MARLSSKAKKLVDNLILAVDNRSEAMYSEYYNGAKGSDDLEKEEDKAKKELIDYIKALENDSNRYC